MDNCGTFSDWEVIKCEDKYDDHNQQKYIKFSCICGAVPNQPCLIDIDGVHKYRAKQYQELLAYLITNEIEKEESI